MHSVTIVTLSSEFYPLCFRMEPVTPELSGVNDIFVGEVSGWRVLSSRRIPLPRWPSNQATRDNKGKCHLHSCRDELKKVFTLLCKVVAKSVRSKWKLKCSKSFTQKSSIPNLIKIGLSTSQRFRAYGQTDERSDLIGAPQNFERV
jgi:hypothetical protein